MTMAITKITATGSMVGSSLGTTGPYPALRRTMSAAGPTRPPRSLGEERRGGEQHDEEDHADHQENGPTGGVDRLVAGVARIAGHPAEATAARAVRDPLRRRRP